MIEIDNKLVSEDILEKEFLCNLSKCKGACCVGGDVGAPLNEEENKILDDTIESWRGSLEQIDDILVMGIRV